MLSKSKIKQIIEQVLNSSTSNQTEVVLSSSKNALTRFANNEIHQNMAWNSDFLNIRVVVNNKIGVASTGQLDEVSIKNTLQNALTPCKLQRADRFFSSLPKVNIKSDNFNNNLTEFSLSLMAEGVSEVISEAKKNNVVASGAYSCEESELSVANSLGTYAISNLSTFNLSTVVIGKNSSGFGATVGKNHSFINAQEVAKTAITKTIESENPTDIEPGEYEIILEPQAVSEMMAFLSWYGLNARIFHEDASCFSGKLGEKVFGENINLIDDPFHKLVFPMLFDYEGFPKQRLEIVKDGILKNIAYDSYHANKYGKKNTGHALVAPNTMGPVPLHMFIVPGNKTKKQMIKNVKRGLLVTRLWYVRVLNPKLLNITGMTRDGTFLIENGKIVRPVKNLRFNQSIVEALNNVVDIENKLTPIASFEGEMISLAPSLHISKWGFSSQTLF